LSWQVEKWLSEQDVDGDGMLSYAEFKLSIAGNLLIDV
jgi:Ca2+-binding EF-hand superfamily protein